MKTLLASCALMALLANAVQAQDIAPPPPAAAQPIPDAGPPPSKDQLEAALELLKATNAMQNVLTMMAPAAIAQIKHEHPGASDAAIARLEAIVHQSIENHQDGLLQIAAIGYARHFSLEDLHAITAFYRSDVGRKYVAEVPNMAQEIAPVENAYLRKVISADVRNAVQSLRAQGEKI